MAYQINLILWGISIDWEYRDATQKKLCKGQGY